MHPDLANLPSDAFDSSPARVPGSGGRPQPQRLAAPVNGLRQTTLFGRDGAKVPASQVNKRFNWPLANKDELPTHHKLDEDATKTWVYPTNLGTVRDYQFNITSRGLYHNTLVALPTGLGKTFIAATIMLNWFRWTKDAQIIFAAPTRPLVTQQVEACFGIAGIPRSQTSMLTGGLQPGLRAEEWQSKRIFFCTPQTLINDLKLGTCDPKRIVLLVIDEAHRATGAYAYVEVVKFIRRFNESFRVLALTATPGSDVESVQKVIDGLDISRVEIRTEQSLDIRRYVHQRKIEKVVFDNSEEMVMLMGLFAKAVQPVLNKLNSQNAYWVKDPVMLTPYGLTKAKQTWFASDAGKHAHMGVKGMVSSIFAILAGLAHAMDLLKYHGITPFFHSLRSFRAEMDEKGSKSKYRRQICESPDFETMVTRLRAWNADPEFIGHPKLSHLRETVLNHLMDEGEGTRIMIFAHWRDSADEIVKVLKRNEPMVKPHMFVGQAASKNTEGMSQKKQEEIVQKFKAGQFNTLVATSIGEEGLDIGEVDLIICYDSKASPIRMLQRMGRTGRKREGKIVLFQMRGKEENDADKAKDSYEKVQEMIADGGRFTFHDDKSRRILPKDVHPIVDKRIIEIPIENTQAELPVPRRGREKVKRPEKKFHMPDGVTTGFITANGGEVGPGRARKQQRVVEEPVPVPGLGEVVLNEADKKAWERQYQHVLDDEDAVVSAPRLDAFPERQRDLSRTKFVQHQARTLALCNKIHSPQVDEPHSRPTLSALPPSPDILVDDESATEALSETFPLRRLQAPRKSTGKPRGRPRKQGSAEAMEADASSPPRTDPRMRLPTQGEWLGSEDTVYGTAARAEDLPDSEMEDFVVDDEEPLSTVDSSLPTVSQTQAEVLQQRSATKKRPDVEILDDSDEDEDSDEDLPDAGALIGKGAKLSTATREKDNVPKAKRRKRVVDDSSDEE